ANPGTTGSPSRWTRVRPPVLLAAVVLGVSVLLHLRDPHRSGSWGFCPWLALTGTYCPGCGGLRAVNDLTRGDLAGAASSNLLFVGSLPFVLFLWGRWLRDSWRGVPRRVDPRRAMLLAGVVLLVALAFTVLRNLPAFAWLAP
ncbi:MAG: DUF2752 domain-containing protein, partial [Nocardioidaceae bacterium]